jgi:hypothetical protein
MILATRQRGREKRFGVKVNIRASLTREFRLSETALNVAGFETIAKMPPKLTFADKTKAELGDALRQVEASFRERSGFEGIAIHSYSSYREMPD